MKEIKFNDKPRRYKYELEENTEIELPEDFAGSFISGQKFFRLGADRILKISRGYQWDGASGPTWDDAMSMRGSLIHDVLYQSMRDRLLDPSLRQAADKFFYTLILEDGMLMAQRMRGFLAGPRRALWRALVRVRAAYYYRALRLFGGPNARPR